MVKARGYNFILFFCVALSAFLLSFFKITSSDAWTLLSSGRLIAQTGKIPFTDVFSYTQAGSPWINTPWLFELLIYNLYQIFGINGLILFKALWITAIFSSLFWWLCRQQVNPLLAALLLCLGIWAARLRFEIRPHLVTLAILPIYYFMLKGYAEGRLNIKKLIFILLPLQIIWANSHGGVIWSLFLVLVFFADTPGQRKPGLFILFVLFTLASFINPYTYKTVFYGLFTGKEQAYTQYILELQPALWQNVYYPYWILLGLGIIAFIFSLRHRFSFTDLAIFLVMAFCSIRYRRFIGEFVVLCVPIIILRLDILFKKIKFKPSTVNLIKISLPFFIIGASLWGMDLPAYALKFGFGTEEKLYPKGAAEFIKENNLSGNMFNPMGFGGYLIWNLYPKMKVFIDGRTDVYGPELLYAEVKYYQPRVWQMLEQKYKLSLAVLSNVNPYLESISSYLDSGKDWALVWWSDAGMIYIKDTPQNKPIIAKNGYFLVKPNHTDLSYLNQYLQDKIEAERLIAELKRNLRLEPDCVLAHTSLAYVYDRLQEYDLARQELMQAIRIVPYRGKLYGSLGTLYLKSNQFQQAITAFNKAVSCGEHDFQIYNNLGAAYYLNLDFAKAAYFWRKALKLEPDNQGVKDNLDKLYG